jgi:hypothetical protein
MKVLCVGTLNPDTTSWARYLGLLLTGERVEVFDTDEYFRSLSVWRKRIKFRLFCGPRYQCDPAMPSRLCSRHLLTSADAS